MHSAKCPGQDTRYWKAEDIHEKPCPHCGETIEFWKTDIRVRCPSCGKKTGNPRFNLGCAAWCAYADKCLGGAASGKADRSLRELLINFIETNFNDETLIAEVKDKVGKAEGECSRLMLDPLPVLASIIFLEASRLKLQNDPEGYVRQLVEERRFPAEAAAETREILANVLEGRSDGLRERIVLGH